ncbi:MAG: hypothetical protein WBN66_06965 [Smithella sp.]
MFRKENKNWKEFGDLIEIIAKTPPKQAPDYFTSGVMARLSESAEMSRAFTFSKILPLSHVMGFEKHVTKTECAFYFLLTGFFYLILGLIMNIGLPLPIIMQNNIWLSFQPLFGLLLAVELTILGIALYKKGDSAIPFVRIGTVLYASLIILNCWISTFYIQPATGLFFIAVFSITGLVLAILLGLAIEHYHPETIFSEVRG